MNTSPCIVFIYGPAGSGKTTFTSRFYNWCLANTSYKLATVNFDPAVRNIPYKPIFDIRDYITAYEIMERYGLGPNGAIIKAVEESSKYLNELCNAIDSSEYDYILFDTPGIMEVFVARDVGSRIIDYLMSRYYIVGLFIMDSSIINKVSEYVYFVSQFILSGLKLGITSIPIWNKISIASDLFNQVSELDINELINIMYEESGLYADAAEKLAKMINDLKYAVRFLKVDSLEYIGFDDIVTVLHEVYCTCGDMT